ncbi:MAG: DUF4268 domain-containing protein [Chloroflexi bacterium]|nr:DUF4268 domain-containing protein [Chloroflexota bacterium]MCY3959046.1 DUF4268 domain-containing protein [Chloroflexota bacterium]
MTQIRIGSIEKVPITSVWPHEANDFTPWLAENLTLLGNELGMELELEGMEVPVGNFSLDILARDANSEAVVAIENQIANTDHTHLGQLLTYSAGKNASVVVWIATEFRDEHRAALDWLNEGTKDSLSFFGIEIDAVRIGDSLPAPLFRLAAAPNTWSKDVAESQAELTPRQESYIRFWRPLLEDLRSSRGWNIGTRNKASSYNAGAGINSGAFGRTMRFTWDEEARVELVIKSPEKLWNKAAFDLLQESRSEIEESLGPMTWERLDDAKMSRVVVSRPGHIDAPENELDQIRIWMIDHLTRFRTTFGPYLEDVLEKMQEAGGQGEG